MNDRAKRPPPPTNSTKTACPTCGKRVKRHGLIDHQRNAHATDKEKTNAPE